jgi:tetratricopeptide (TPR) repeat protein
MGEERYDYDVFISHSRAERGWVRDELLPRLEGAGLRACLDWRDFQPGAPRAAEVERAVTRSRHTLLVLTPAYLADEWAEFGDLLVQALDPAARERRLLPLLKARCDLPLRIRHLTCVDFADPEEPEWAWAQLLTALGAPPEQAAPAEPTPENWRLAHPYGMPPNFTGRADERALLSEWLESDAIHPLLVLRALGGFGKSALAWHWLLHDVDAARWPRVVWWCFYDERDFEEFLRQTLEYLGATLPAGPRQQADVLLRLLHQPGTLLILDGFERALRAYGTLDAPYLGDTPSPLPSVGRGEGAGGWGEGQQDCLSPTSDYFLRAVSALPGLQSKVLLTTRLRPHVLEAVGGDLLAGCREQELAHMQPPDAVAFFRAQGIRGSRAEIEAACAPYGYHPLSLRLLVGLVVRDPQQPGDVVAARHLDVSGEQVARQHHVLERAYGSLASPGQRLLSRMACFRGPVGYKAIAAIGMGDPDADVGDRQGHPHDVDADLRDLVARGLVHHDRRANRYDLHPIVRRYAYDRLTGGERAEAHRTLRDYFAAVPPPERLRTLDDLAPVIELYHHTVRAGQYDEACDLFYDRLDTPTYFQFGAYQLQIELLLALFPDGEDRPPRLKKESDQAWTLSALASSYSLSGQPHRAVPLVEASNAIDEKRGDKRGVAIGLGNLADDQLKVGLLRAAEASLRRQIALCQEIEDERNEAVGHQELGRLLAYRGAWAEAEKELAAAETVFDEYGPEGTSFVSVVRAYRALCALLLARTVAAHGRAPLHTTALAAARRALDLADETARTHYPVERDYVHAHWLLGAAHRASGDGDAADRHLAEALARCRGINAVEAEADILLDLARLRADIALTPGPSPKAGRGEQALTPDPSPKAERGESLDEALRLAEEALLIADRCGYVLQEADVHLFLAHLALERGEREAAREHARQARELATCDGPPDYTYKVAYDEAGALLAQL